MKNSLTYLTRRCPRNCGYCALRDAVGVGRELTKEEWVQAFQILKKLGIDFNLILGNETWLLGHDLKYIMERNEVPYALYSTAPGTLFEDYKKEFLQDGVIDNFSCGVDFPYEVCMQGEDDMYKKGKAAWEAFRWIKENTPEVDCHATITVHKKNCHLVHQIIKDCSEIGVHIAVNYIQFNKDGGFDFFAGMGTLNEYLFTEEDESLFHEMVSNCNEYLGLLQNPMMLALPFQVVCSMGWHCGENPYGGPTIDADGTLRVCGYRKGVYTPKLTIFDLPEKLELWKDYVARDCKECPGCTWSYPLLYQHFESNPEMGKKVFNNHAGHHIPKEKWANRIINK